MAKKQVPWAAVNRGRGESVDSWMRRNRAHHQRAWQADKIARGEWLPADEFAKVKGRPGKPLSEVAELLASSRRAARTELAPRETGSTSTPAKPRRAKSARGSGAGGAAV
ncbi:MAG: hypothetical protein FJ104_16830, partial [Deltaproteobacteria bacterium]|nr:hypothetical protein [Deltaproteobacteria bacterium]